MLSSSLWHEWDTWEWMEADPGETQTGHQEAFPYRKGAQTLKQASLGGCKFPEPTVLENHLDRALSKML